MADRSTCLSPLCGITIAGSARICPQCGWAMRSSRNIRVRGGLVLACGLFLALFMGWIAWSLLPSLARPGVIYENGTFAGTGGQARLILLLFAAVVLFGLVGILNGLYMIASGRQNRWFVLVTFVLAAIVAGVAWVATRALK